MHTICLIIFSTIALLFIVGATLSYLSNSKMNEKDYVTSKKYVMWSGIANGLGVLLAAAGLLMTVFGKDDHL